MTEPLIERFEDEFADDQKGWKKLAGLSIPSDVDSFDTMDMSNSLSTDQRTISDANSSRTTLVSSITTTQSLHKDLTAQYNRTLAATNMMQKSKKGQAASKTGEIISFHVKRKKQDVPAPQLQTQKAPSQNKEPVVLLETSDPDFFYSLAAKDKFGKMYEMSELNDKVLLVKLNENSAAGSGKVSNEPLTEDTSVSSYKSKRSSKQNLTVLRPRKPTTVAKKPLKKDEVPRLADPNFFYNIEIEDKFGKKYPMSKWKGKVIIILNSASKCGFASQLAELQLMYEKYRDQGLVILLFPTSQFGVGQELKSDNEILEFCKVNYGVSFHIMKKIKVNGPDEHVLFSYLKHVKRNPLGMRRITWNFEKFLIDRNGYVIKRSPPYFKPKKLVPLMELLLAQEPSK